MVIKGEAGEIEIKVTPIDINHCNDDWITAEIKITVPGFNAWYGTSIRVDELRQFCEDLIKLDNLTAKRAEFTTLEQGLYLECNLQKNGHVLCSGTAITENGDSLNFTIQTDLASINKSISQLKTTVSQFSVRSVRDAI